MVRRALALVMVFATLAGAVGTAAAQPPVENDAQTDDPTPARLSYTAGSVSFWRPGGADWAPAQTNTPLATGDELYTGHDGNLEVQVGGSAFVRAWGDTQLGLANQDPNFVQIRVTAGHVALDFGALDPGDVVEIATPGAAFSIDQPGYYRIDVASDRTSFVARRGGRATMTPAAGTPAVVAEGEAVVLDGPTPSVQRVAAPESDVWDRWNEARTAALLTTVSARYVPPQVYGASELDRYGTWRSDATYGSVWVPATVAPGWVPYSTGRWIWDPRFGWTWIDNAPWGWAPYHYGRWVHLGGVWAWAPGPVVARPVYAPALVAFFGSPGVSVTVAGPAVGWVALGWGEPVVPWWGRPGFVGRTWWGGWGGPRVRHVTVHRNVTVVNAVVVVRSDHFGRRPVHEARIARPDIKRLEPVRGRLAVKPEAASFTPSSARAPRPPQSQVSRQVVSTRPPARRPDPPHADDKRDGRADARPDARPGARGDAKPDARGDGKAGPPPAVRGDARPDAKGDGKPDARPGVRGGVKPDAAGDGKPGQPPGARSDTRPDAKGDAKLGPRPGVRGDGKPDPKPDVRRDGARDTRPDAQHERRPDARNDARPERKAPSAETPAAKVAPPAPPAPPATPQRPPTPPRSEIRRPEPPRAAPPRPETQRPEPPRGEPQRPEPQRPEPPRGEPRRSEPPRSQAPRIEPRGGVTTSVEPRRAEIPRAEPARVDTPRRAAVPVPDTGRRTEPARVVSPPRPAVSAPGQSRSRPSAPARGERGRQER